MFVTGGRYHMGIQEERTMDRSVKNALYKCSTKGLIQLLNDPKYANNPARQYQDMINYIARHEMYGGNTKGELFEMIHVARNELLAQYGEKHKDSKEPFAYDNFGNVSPRDAQRIKNFLRDPSTAVMNEFAALGNVNLAANGEDEEEKEYLRRLQVNAQMLSKQVEVSADSQNTHFKGCEARTDILTRIEKKCPEEDKNALDSLKKTNGNFFTRLFRRPSQEYKAFEQSFKQFGKTESVLSGNVEDLEKKTTAYLKHLMPNFKYAKDMNKEEMLAALPKGQRARASFAMNVLDSIHENKEAKPYVDNVENAINGRPIKEIEKAPAPVDPVKQQQFQNEIAANIEEPKVEEVKNEVKAEPEKVEEKQAEANNEITN
jgi:hypothetical protein